jgi:tetratricopeptide (TPR) repeat protein
MALHKEQEKICRQLGNLDGLQASLGNQALILKDRGDLDGAMALHKEEEKICRQLGNLAGLQASLGNQALILQDRGDLDGAMALHKEKERICRQLDTKEGLAITLGNQALLLGQNLNRWRAALPLAEEAHQIATSADLTTRAQWTQKVLAEVRSHLGQK